MILTYSFLSTYTVIVIGLPSSCQIASLWGSLASIHRMVVNRVILHLLKGDYLPSLERMLNTSYLLFITCWNSLELIFFISESFGMETLKSVFASSTILLCSFSSVFSTVKSTSSSFMMVDGWSMETSVGWVYMLSLGPTFVLRVMVVNSTYLSSTRARREVHL